MLTSGTSLPCRPLVRYPEYDKRLDWENTLIGAPELAATFGYPETTPSTRIWMHYWLQRLNGSCPQVPDCTPL